MEQIEKLKQYSSKSAALKSKRGNYKYVTNETRSQLVYLSEVQKLPMNEICELLDLKYTTAKSIMMNFKKGGRVARLKRSGEERIYFHGIKDDKTQVEEEQKRVISEIKKEGSQIVSDLIKKIPEASPSKL